MTFNFHGQEYSVMGFARSTVLPEVFILLQGENEMLVAPTHDLSGLKYGGADLNEIKGKYTFPIPRLETQA